MRLAALLRMRASAPLRVENFAKNLVQRNIGAETGQEAFWPSTIKGVVLIAAAMYAGKYFDDLEQDRMSKFRDKSKLFAGINPDPENNPSWGRPTKDMQGYRTSEW